MPYRALLLPATRRALCALLACGSLAMTASTGPTAGLRILSGILAGSAPVTALSGPGAVATMGLRN